MLGIDRKRSSAKHERASNGEREHNTKQKRIRNVMHQSKVELQHTNIRALIENERVEHMKKQRVWTENESTTNYVRVSTDRIVVPLRPSWQPSFHTRASIESEAVQNMNARQTGNESTTKNKGEFATLCTKVR